MKLKVDFEILDPASGKISPANMTLNNPPAVPVVGDVVPTANCCYKIVQRAYLVERSTIDNKTLQLTIVCTLAPVVVEEDMADAE